MVQRLIVNLCFFFAGLAAFFGWTEFVDNEMHVQKFQGEVIQRKQFETVVEMGANVITYPSYKIVLSTGKELLVPRSIYQQLKTGEHAVIMKQKDRIMLSQ
jgi:hypothetical protein